MKVVRNIKVPSLIAYLPDLAIATRTAVVICPGGGFSCLPIDHEGMDLARWLNTRGIAAFVLKYRLLPTAPGDSDFLEQFHRPDMAQVQTQSRLAVEDGILGMNIIRQDAARWSIDHRRIGTIGFSAGGVVATGIAALAEQASRPNFVASIYSPGWQDLNPQTNALPLFMAFASDDPVLALVNEGSMRLYSAWKDAGHSVEMHIYSKGGHGFGMATQNLPSDHWIDQFANWLHVQGFPVKLG